MTADKIGFSEVGALVGETVGNYRITDLIGQGGMGVVYRAEHVLLGKRAAVKVLLPERCSSREIVDRFFNEAKASTLIEDPGIVDIFDFGTLPDGNAYIVMELLDGETLGDRLKRLGNMSPNQAVAIARHIAGTLAAAHSHGIIHRDLKPDNVFLVRDSALPRGERAKLLDFGIAKLASHTQPAELVKTETGRLMGTPYYMSPEQCRGAGKIDHRTDIYSLGCVLYQMLTGRPPFVLEGAGEILAAHIHVPPLPLRTHEPTVPSGLEAVVLRMLQKDPVRRFQSAEDVVTALNRAAQRFTGEEDAPEPSLKQSGKLPQLMRSSPNASKDPAFTEATTLNSTGGELSDWAAGGADVHTASSSPLQRLWPWIVGSALAALIGAIVTMMVVGGKDDDRARKRKAAAARMAQPPPPPVVAPPPPPPPPPPVQDPIVRELETAREEETVKLMVHSTPEGAFVYRESDGVRLGRTPLEVRARKGRGEAVFILRRNGYRTERLAVPVDQDQKSTVVLRTRGSSAPAATRIAPVGQARPKQAPAPPSPPAPDPDGAVVDPFPEEKPGEILAPEDTPKTDGQPGDEPIDPDEKAGDKGDNGDKKKAADKKKRGKDDALDPFNRLRKEEGEEQGGAGRDEDAKKEKE
jgi:serine/threonine-protein kinase